MKATILILLLTGLLFNSLQAQDKGSSKKDFLRMASYLSSGTGKWMTKNPNYDPENLSSSKGFGLWFTQKLKQNLLHLTHVVYRGDTAHVTGESYWLWHPGEQRINYYSISNRGNFTDGETYFVSDEKFITTEYSFSPDGQIQLHKDENIIISEDEHKTISSYYENSKWHVIGNYTFIKNQEKKYHKVIKYY